jgi:hypothetical protein
MIKRLTLLLLWMGAFGLGHTRLTDAQATQTPQITPSSPQIEQRDQPVTEEDVRILARVSALLSDDTSWNRKDERECQDDEAVGRRSLFCALQRACIDVLGRYDHRRVALQEVRFAVEDATRGRDFEHRLRDFNNLPETRLADIKAVLRVAAGRVQARLETAAAALPRFDRVLLLEATSETSANVHIGDVNGDGHLDVVLAKGRHWGLVDRVLLGDGRGRFPESYDLGKAADRTYSGNLVDLDRDGDLDVVISNDAPDPKRIYFNNGKGHFSEGGTYGRAEWSTRNAAVADVNGDGMPDIVVANRTPPGRGGNYVCLNQGGGRFPRECVAFSRESATTVTPADVNRDGLIDLVVPHRDGGPSQIYFNASTRTTLAFRAVPFGLPDAAIRVSAAADVDRDGSMDLVAIDEKRGLFTFFGQPGGTMSAPVAIGERGRTPYALAVADLNLDGAPDIIVGHVQAPSIAFINDGTGRKFTPIDFGDGKGTPYGFDIADLDSDGRPDIAVARSEAPNVVYFADGGARR